MGNKEMFKRVAIVTALSLSASIFTSGCGVQKAEAMSSSVEEVVPVEEEVPEEEEPEEISVSENSVSENEVTEEETFTLTELDIQMIATQETDTYENPSSESKKIGAVQKDEAVHIIAQVDNTNWFKIEQEESIQSFIDGKFLTEYTEPEEPEEEVQQPVQQEQQPAEVQQPQEEVKQPVDEGTDDNPYINENGEYAPINPETGQPYQEGDVIPGMGGIWTGDHSDIWDQNWDEIMNS